MFFRDGYAFLSNMYPCEISYEGLTFRCVEAAYQAAKTLDRKAQEKFQKYTGTQAKRAGKALCLRDDWEDVKVHIMKELIDVKFNESFFAKALMDVKEPIIEDNVWGDMFWGKCNGEGINMLGKLLMEKRRRLLLGTIDATALLGEKPDAKETAMVGIYQIKSSAEYTGQKFMDLEHISQVNSDMYELVYATPFDEERFGRLDDTGFTNADRIYAALNFELPRDFYGHTPSVSDIILIRKGLEKEAFYVQGIGFCLLGRV